MTSTQIQVGGGIVFTALGLTDRAKLKAAFPAAYEKFVPEPQPPSAALRDALEQHFKTGDNKEHVFRIERLEDKNGFEVVDVARGMNGNQYRPILVARIDQAYNQIKFSPFDGHAMPIVEAYNKHLGYIPGSRVNSSLVAILNVLGGTTLRPNGCIYWLPDYQLPEWLSVAAAVEQAGVHKPNNCFLLRHGMDADAVKAIQYAITAEISAQAERIQREVQSGELGERALENRRQEAEGVRRKIHEYEEILQVSLSSLTTAIDVAENAAMTASLLAAGAA